MTLNKQIEALSIRNTMIKPVNMTQFNNAFMLLSETEALNKLVVNTNPSSRAAVGNIEPKDSHILGKGLTIYEPSENEAENLARHVMNEVYTSPENRRDISGYTMLNSLSDDRNLVYKSNKSNTILYGIRGTDPLSGSDWVTDLSIAADKGGVTYLDGPMNERYDNANKIYSDLRNLYPKSKIIIGGHSLGNSVGLDLLYKHQSDDNIDLYGYNGYFHPVYTGKKDPRNHPQRTEGDIVSWWNSDKAKKFKTPVAKGVELTGAVVIGGYVANKVRKIRNLESRIKAGNELYARNMAIQYRGGEMASMDRDAEGVWGNIVDPVYQQQLQQQQGFMETNIAEFEAFLNSDPDSMASKWDAGSPKERRQILKELKQNYDKDWENMGEGISFEGGSTESLPQPISEDAEETKEDEGEARIKAEAEEAKEAEQSQLDEIFAEDITKAADYQDILAAEEALTSTLEIGATGGYGAIILGIGYGFYSHLSGNFKPEHNFFKKKS